MVFKSEVFEMSERFNDPTDAMSEAVRTAELRGSNPYQRGIARAQAQELVNVRGAFLQGLADLKRVTGNRDKNVPGRDAYDRCYQRVTKAGERLALIAPEGEVIRMPVWLPPPELTEADTVVVGKPAFDVGTYKESKGHGPSGKGLPLKGPGSNVDPDWTTK
jgi:hypothetical protein